MDKIEMEPVFILMLRKTEDGKRLTISGYFAQIIQGKQSFLKMSPTSCNNKNKKTDSDDETNREHVDRLRN